MTDAPNREIDMRNVGPPVARFIDHTDETRALPGVASAALAGNVPMGPSASPVFCSGSQANPPITGAPSLTPSAMAFSKPYEFRFGVAAISMLAMWSRVPGSQS